MIFSKLNSNRVLVGLISILVLSLYYTNLNGYWRGDDTAILLHVIKHPIWGIFIIPEIWQELSPSNLTPWVSLSFCIDYSLSGLTPSVFYLHHLMQTNSEKQNKFLLFME